MTPIQEKVHAVVRTTKNSISVIFSDKETGKFFEFLDEWFQCYLRNPETRFSLSYKDGEKELFACALSAQELSFAANGVVYKVRLPAS